MCSNKRVVPTAIAEPTEEEIRKSLHALLDLLAREVAQRLPKHGSTNVRRSRPASKSNPGSVS
jgi:hypothetical protein